MANKKWKHEYGNIENLQLIFEPFYEEIIVANLFKDEDGDWCYSSELLSVDDMYLCDRGTNENDAKLEVEELIYSHYASERDYYQTLIDLFNE